MNIQENDIDRLTRGLMRDTAEQPSPALNSRIMALIMQEKRRVFKYYVKARFTPAGIIGSCVAYLFIVVGILFVAKNYAGENTALYTAMKSSFPILLTVASAVSFFFLFTQLDNWMKREEIKKKHLSGL